MSGPADLRTAGPRHIGVAGAGTMGAGIAAVALAGGFQVTLYDVAGEILEHAQARIAAELDRLVRRGRLTAEERTQTLGSVRLTTHLEDLAAADLIIEAAPEDLALKRDLFARLDRLAPPRAILASNTSSLAITALAGATARPERVVGMHFFNPAPVMALVEVIPGRAASREVVERAAALARALGKTPVEARDTPGFIVNRIARPYYLEALRILGEGVATVEQIDRIMRLAGGFRMGPFELLDLIGLDVNLAVTKSIYGAFFHEPRYRPHPLQEQMVQAGLLGRKTGQGFYAYGERAGPQRGGEEPRPDREPPRRVAVLGVGPLADQLLAATKAAGLTAKRVLTNVRLHPDEADVVVGANLASWGTDETTFCVADLPQDVPIVMLTHAEPVWRLPLWKASSGYEPRRSIAGFVTLPPLDERRLVEIVRGDETPQEAVDVARAYFAALGKETVVIGDGVGGVFPRVVAMIVNEAAFALQERVADPEDIDTALRLGANYPSGPLALADRIGLDVIEAILSGLRDESGEERYRVAPLIRRMVVAGWTGAAAGRGFYTYREGEHA